MTDWSAFHLARAERKRQRRRERNRRVWGDRSGYVFRKRRRLIP